MTCHRLGSYDWGGLNASSSFTQWHLHRSVRAQGLGNAVFQPSKPGNCQIFYSFSEKSKNEKTCYVLVKSSFHTSAPAVSFPEKYLLFHRTLLEG